ncbi:MAG: DUF255 domain-containing protein, partial [Planctomycetota bacterium]
MSNQLKNNMADSNSAYLRSAANQPVFWQEWTEESFKLANELDRPILLDIGAIWCHWCHVMDKESYEDTYIAELINNNFVPIRVDRDIRPDLDWRYQTAVSALTGTGGWPLTVFLLPDGEPFLGATYIPRENEYGVTGFKTLLEKVAQAYSEERQSLIDLSNTIRKRLTTLDKKIESGAVIHQLVSSACNAIISSLDKENGGLNQTGPKFPSEPALQLAIVGSHHFGYDRLLHMAAFTLSKMAFGGLHDQIGGGFHRYSIDPHWHVPHFEKILRSNALLMSLYAEVYSITGNKHFKEVALSTMSYINNTLLDKESGAFFASQNSGSADKGESYYTWNMKELEAVLSQEEFNVLSLYYDIKKEPRGIQGLPGENVLRVAKSRRKIAETLGISIERVAELIESGKKRLTEVRSLRIAPAVDNAVYADANGVASVSYFNAY